MSESTIQVAFRPTNTFVVNLELAPEARVRSCQLHGMDCQTNSVYPHAPKPVQIFAPEFAGLIERAIAQATKNHEVVSLLVDNLDSEVLQESKARFIKGAANTGSNRGMLRLRIPRGATNELFKEGFGLEPMLVRERPEIAGAAGIDELSLSIIDDLARPIFDMVSHLKSLETDQLPKPMRRFCKLLTSNADDVSFRMGLLRRKFGSADGPLGVTSGTNEVKSQRLSEHSLA